MNKRIVLCGASRGIGLALAEILTENPYRHLILLSRNIDGLREKFSQHKNVLIVPFDLEQDASAQLSHYMK